MNRRQFLVRSTATVAGASVLTGLYAWRIEPHWVEFVRRPLLVPLLPADLHGKTVAQLSDFHVGHRVDDAYLISTCQRVAELNPDFVVFTGDFISYDASTQLDQLAGVLAEFPRGRLGTFAVLGNHDYGPQWSHPEVAAAVSQVAERAGITVLRNANARAAGLQVIGCDDLWGQAFRPERAFQDAEIGMATIVLSHNPDTVDLSGWTGYHGSILSGHTHGGQCKPPFLPPPLLPVENKRYTSGEFELPGGRRLYISRGVGHLLRVRFNVRPEVTIFELHS